MNSIKWKAFIRKDSDSNWEFFVGINWIWLTLAAILVWVLI